MTKQEWQERLPIIQAFIEGKEIEVSDIKHISWSQLTDAPTFDKPIECYRIKEEPKIIPFTFEDADSLIGRAIKTKSGDIMFIVVCCQPNSMSTISRNMSYEILLTSYTFLDGSPCGKLDK